MLDTDAREVKMLKNMLIEDEEETGANRERQFKWKNVNDTNWDDANPTDAADKDAALHASDEENEEAWRKMRHERELLLKEKAATDLTDVTLQCPSPSAATVAAAPKRRITIVKSSANTPPVAAKTDSPFLISRASGILGARNSFLGRDEQTLARLAALSKPEVEGGAMAGVSKGGGNFVFSTLSPAVADTEKGRAGKRKSDTNSDDTNPAAKKKTKNSSTNGTIKKRLLDSLT